MLDDIAENSKPTAEEALNMVPAAIDQLDREALRQRVRDYVATNSTSYKGVALMAGVAESTFTAWLGGKYRGNNDRIEADIRVWLKSEEQLGKRRMVLPVDAKFSPTRSALKFMAALEHAQAMPDVAVIAAGAGVGKTTTCTHYKATRPNVWILTAEPSMATPYAMLEYLREVLGLPETPPHKTSRAVTMKLQGTQGLVIIDEAQHLSIKCIDQMRMIYDRAGIGLALVGNEEVWGRIDGGGRKAELAQLFSRVGIRVTVGRPTAKDIEILLDASEITDPKQRAVLKTIAGKPGALRAMVKTLRLARMVALGSEEELNDTHIMSAWHRLSGGQDAVA
jgi:DNA transposition AAA+ family ATPase